MLGLWRKCSGREFDYFSSSPLHVISTQLMTRNGSDCWLYHYYLVVWGFLFFLLGNGTAFTGTKRNEITFNERKRPHYSHQQQLLTATLPINKEHLRVWLLDLWTWSNLLALISFFWAQTLGAHSYRFGGLIRTENWTEWSKALTFNHYQLGLW